MLVTGASGFVGGAVARAAVDAGWTVVTTSRRDAGVPGARHVTWDLDAGPPPAGALGEVDVVVHAAAWVGDWGRSSDVRRTTVGGTRAVLAALPGARVVHISSASVYDPMRPSVRSREQDAPVSRYLSAYAAAKAAAEGVVLASGAPGAVVLRPHAVYGPRDTTLLPRVLGAVRGGRLLIPGTGTVLQSLTHVDNLVAAVLAVARRTVPGRLVVNVADAEPVVLREALLELLARRGLGHVRVLAVPAGLARVVAGVAETAFRTVRSPRPPRLTRYAVSHLAMERTLDLTVLRGELGVTTSATTFDGAQSW